MKGKNLPGLAGLPQAGILAISSPNPCLSVCMCAGCLHKAQNVQLLSATAHICLFHPPWSVQQAFHLTV